MCIVCGVCTCMLFTAALLVQLIPLVCAPSWLTLLSTQLHSLGNYCSSTCICSNTADLTLSPLPLPPLTPPSLPHCDYSSYFCCAHQICNRNGSWEAEPRECYERHTGNTTQYRYHSHTNKSAPFREKRGTRIRRRVPTLTLIPCEQWSAASFASRSKEYSIILTTDKS